MESTVFVIQLTDPVADNPFRFQTTRDSSGEVIKGTIEEMTEYVW
jgi:hypothetical protein